MADRCSNYKDGNGKGGIAMNEKVISEFYEREEEIAWSKTQKENKKFYIIEVMAYALDEKEHEKTRAFIEQHNGRFTRMDSDSIFAIFEYNNYEDAMKMLKELEQEGWKW